MFERLKIRKKNPRSPEQKKYRKKILLRKILLYAVLVVSFIVVFINNASIYMEKYKARLDPQIRRAVIQVAQIIPQLEERK